MGREEGGEGYFPPRLTLSYPAKNVRKMGGTKEEGYVVRCVNKCAPYFLIPWDEISTASHL